jgi:hypothetical protein
MSTIQRNVTGRRAGGKSAPASAPEADEWAKKKDAKNDKSSARAQLAAAGVAEKDGDAPDRRPHRSPVAGTTHISGPALCRRYGIVGMTLRRWETSGKLGFPQPRWINNRKFWLLAEVEHWERARVATPAQPGQRAPDIGRLRQELSASSSRAEAQRLIATAVFDQLPRAQREAALAELIDLINGLPERPA